MKMSTLLSAGGCQELLKRHLVILRLSSGKHLHNNRRLCNPLSSEFAAGWDEPRRNGTNFPPFAKCSRMYCGTSSTSAGTQLWTPFNTGFCNNDLNSLCNVWATQNLTKSILHFSASVQKPRHLLRWAIFLSACPCLCHHCSCRFLFPCPCHFR